MNPPVLRITATSSAPGVTGVLPALGRPANSLLDAIARSDGTRASVRRQLFATRVHNGIVGTFTITPHGDTTARTITIYRVAQAKLRPWQVITPSADLLDVH
jgi:hypothetical protein